MKDQKNIYPRKIRHEKLRKIIYEFSYKMGVLNEKRCKKFIQIMCSIPRPDGVYLPSEKNYDVVCKFNPNPQKISDLFILKELATDDIIMKFNSKSSERDKYPLLPLSNSEKNKIYPGIINNNEDDFEVLTLNVPINYILFLKKINEWIFKVLITYLQNFHIQQHNITYMCINACYIAAWLIVSNPENDFKKTGQRFRLQLAAIVGMFCAGFNDVYTYSVILPTETIYEIFNSMSMNIYGKELINDMCAKYEPILKNKKFVTIYDFINDPIEIKRIMTDNSATDNTFQALYNDPKSVLELIGARKSDDTETYTFPFEEITDPIEPAEPAEPELTIADTNDVTDVPTTPITGGQRLRKHRKTYKKRVKKTRNKRKLKRKRKTHRR